MNSDFESALRNRLNEFRDWSGGQQFQGCRLVCYSAAEFAGAADTPFDEVEREIEGALSEGFAVNWAEHKGSLYLCVWEASPESPPWPRVFAEEDVFEWLDPMRDAVE